MVLIIFSLLTRHKCIWIITVVINKISSEPKDAQSRESQEISNKTEVSTVKNQNPVDSNNKSTSESKMISGIVNENPNSKRKTNSFAYFEELNSNLFTSNSSNSNESNELSKEDQSNFVNSESLILQNKPYAIVSTKQLNDSVENFIEETSSIHFIRAQELLECKDSLSYDLAVKTIQGIKRNEESGWVLIGIAAYRIWINTPALPGGAGNTAGPEEGRMNALENLANDCSRNGRRVMAKTLYDYVRRIKVFLEEPLKAFAGSDEETIRHKRTVLMEKLFAVPSSFARAAVSTTKPLEALELLAT